MLLFAESDGYRLAERLRRLRQQPLAAYAIALAVFAIATLARWVIEDYVPGQIPFIFYFPAVVIATLLGGLWPRLFVGVLSGLIAGLAFMTNHQTSGEKLAALVAFACASLFLVTIVTAFNWCLRTITPRGRAPPQWRSGEVPPCRNRRVLKDLSGTITSWNAGAERLFGYTAEEVIDKPINSSLAQQIVKRQFGGTLAYDWKPEGLVVRLSLPKDRLES